MCKNHQFVQIHCHSSFSNLDGVALTEKLVQKAKEYGHPALATTEHGSPAGLFDHYNICKKHGIKPILGLEFYICNDLESRIPFKDRELKDRDFHQSLYIKDKEGYQNFNYLTYVSFTDGFYYKPRIDYDLLMSRNKGLMATSSCIASGIHNLLTADNIKEAEALFLKFRNSFGDDFYGEIQFNELNDRDKWGIDQKRNNQFIIDMCQKHDVPILIGGDVHYVEKEDNRLQDALIASKRSGSSKDGNVFQIHARHLYYHDTSDYYELNKKFGYNYDTKFLEQCFENSIKFAEKPNFEFETGKYHLPKIKTNGMDSKAFLEKITWEGIEKRITKQREHNLQVSDELIDAYETQIPHELKIIDELGLNDYLLIVQDIINWEKSNGIFVGPGRGCFLPNSMVTLSNGLKVRIKDVMIGDKVSNYFSGEGEVVNSFKYNVDEELVELEFENGKIISCTKDHEIYTKNRGWVKADNLTIDDDIQEIN